ncbi:hypothetical protein [Streptomyces sp. SPB074]|uniref:hypothetical protein n=1 Tax=Streptomyces sp. (strain SPB074) TaxID=465543 RepID=UPI00017FEE09|nr:hypothetical protein [Streptomyces sp. SPB074]EDY45873.1 membrane protein [Streptomyces sp. SPB074]
MAQAIRPPSAHQPSANSLVSGDGRPHPLQNTLTALTVALGFLAFVSSFFHSFHLLSSWAGLVGLAVGGWGQYISVTTRERFGLIIGMGAAGIGLLVGMAHGGLFGGVIGG